MGEVGIGGVGPANRRCAVERIDPDAAGSVAWEAERFVACLPSRGAYLRVTPCIEQVLVALSTFVRHSARQY